MLFRSQQELRRRRYDPNPNDVARSMPERWKAWILTSLPHLNHGTLQSVYDRLRDSPQSDTDIDRVQRTWLMHRIQQEIDFRNGADSQAQEPEPTASPQRIYRVWDTRPGGDSWVYPSDSAEAALLRVKRQQGVPEQYLAVESYNNPSILINQFDKTKYEILDITVTNDCKNKSRLKTSSQYNLENNMIFTRMSWGEFRDEDTYNNLVESINYYNFPSGTTTVSITKKSVTLYEYEFDLNESKRSIKLLKKEFATRIEQNLIDLMI